VAEFCETVEDRVEQLDAASLRSWRKAGCEGLQDPEVDGEKDVGDVGGETKPRLRRLFALGLQQLLV